MNILKKLRLFKNTRKVVLTAFQYIILIGLCYYILSPIFLKISMSFMSENDLLDKLVVYIPRKITFWNYKTAASYLSYWQGLFNTFMISAFAGVIQMMVCTFIGYGLARFEFKGKSLIMLVVFLTIITPPMTYQTPMYLFFRYFDVFGLIKLIHGSAINLLDSFWPLFILSITGFGFKNGVYIYMMRQYFRGFPAELEEAAYVDGSGVFRTFFVVILPNAKAMLVTIFMFAFAWQWTDTLYSTMFFSKIKTLSNLLSKGFEGMMVAGRELGLKGGQPLTIALTGTYSLMVIIPLILIYIVVQRQVTEGIERSGIVG